METPWNYQRFNAAVLESFMADKEQEVRFTAAHALLETGFQREIEFALRDASVPEDAKDIIRDGINNT